MEQQNYTDKPTLAKWNELVSAAGAAPKVAAGTYTGSGSGLTTVVQTINLGFRPKAVFIVAEMDDAFNRYAALVTDKRQHQSSGIYVAEITATGFLVRHAYYVDSTITPRLNSQGYTYIYLAVG